MDPRPERPAWLPVERAPERPPAVPPPTSVVPTTAEPTGTVPRWRRLVRTPRGAAGLAIVAAALLLWPFAGWSVIPWLVGIGVLVVLRLLRLDGLLRGWALHVGGIVVVAGLMYSTGPWAWALAASIGVLLAGLVMLPQWKVAAVGAVLCVIAGVGFGISQYRAKQQQDAEQAAENAQSYSLQGERTPQRVPGALLEDVSQNDVVAFCGLLDQPARAQVIAATSASDCSAAMAVLRSRAGTQYPDVKVPVRQEGDHWIANACGTPWASSGLGGTALGQIEIRKSEPPGGTYFVSHFSPC